MASRLKTLVRVVSCSFVSFSFQTQTHCTVLSAVYKCEYFCVCVYMYVNVRYDTQICPQNGFLNGNVRIFSI